PKNESGYCVLSVEDGVKSVETRILYSDEDILSEVMKTAPDLVAVDAPLIFSGVNRKCDELLHGYGALPVTLRGMEVLARRGSAFAVKLRGINVKFIEVFSTASAKILGVYSKNDFGMQKSMMSLGIRGSVSDRILSRDELDAVLAAVTGFLHLEKQTREVGDESGVIMIPEV
ncbi:MAG: DUF429 domain-containing protein, partial [Candidatus Altiarchaeota archaeon]|nr:DUF429 domain-containing protein [Candidatus Altiarchaeota archaeon]